MNKKGFTLIELMGIIIILSLISLLVIPTIDQSIKLFKENAYDNQIKNIELASKLWSSDHLYNMDFSDGDVVTISLGQLKSESYIKDELRNPVTNELFNDNLMINIYKIDNKTKYVVDSGSITNTNAYSPNSPIIVLNGDYVEKIYQDSIYLDKGVTAKTSTGALITSITTTIYYNNAVVGSVDTSIVDKYLIAYSVTDNGLTRTAYRTVSVETLPSTVASAPELAANMIPITRDVSNTKWVKADITTAWYDYTTKKWANAVLVTSTSRAGYLTAAAGTEVLEADVMAYLVWIPRYQYKLFNVGGLVIPEQTIQVRFQSKSQDKSLGTANGEWLTHPAFSFGTTELNGFWVGKFETTGTAATPTIKPTSISLKSQTVSAQFATAQLFNTTTTYGLTSANDSHMMRNLEWGAVTYLTQSIYGKNAEVWTNPAGNTGTGVYITGCAGNSASEPPTTTCLYEYTTANGLHANTTDNIYGIYDMAGGEYEYTMGALYNSGNTTIAVSSSGFVQATIDGAGMAKYIDKYIYGTTNNDQTAYNRRILGDATSETRGWNNDGSSFVYSANQWFLRGGAAYTAATTGLFDFGNLSGTGSWYAAFRTVVLGG